MTLNWSMNLPTEDPFINQPLTYKSFSPSFLFWNICFQRYTCIGIYPVSFIPFVFSSTSFSSLATWLQKGFIPEQHDLSLSLSLPFLNIITSRHDQITIYHTCYTTFELALWRPLSILFFWQESDRTTSTTRIKCQHMTLLVNSVLKLFLVYTFFVHIYKSRSTSKPRSVLILREMKPG